MTTLAIQEFGRPVALQVKHACRGDVAAFNDLVEQHQRLVFAVCYRLLGERQTAEDATQETFIVAWRNLDKINPESFRAWILAVASNTSKSLLRKRGRRPEAPLDIAFDREDAQPGPEIRTLSQEIARDIKDCFDRLPEDQRQALALWHEAGLDYQEIANVTQTNIGTVKSRISRGRRRLGGMLRERRTYASVA
jgi:RNA polymerase sigma factor (sigma-70 family)